MRVVGLEIMDNKLEPRTKRQGKREEGREKRGQDEEKNEICETGFLFLGSQYLFL